MAAEFENIDGANITDFGGGGGPITPITVNSGDVSGGSTSSVTAAASEQIEEFASEGGGVLAIVYGEHLIAGHLVVHKFTAGTPNTSIIIVLLGEGQGDKGLHGEWADVVNVWYAGAALSVSPNGSTAGYRFYKGYISTGIADANQPVDAFLTGGLAYSGTPYIAAKLPDAIANAEDRPDKLRGRYKGRRVHSYDRAGNAVLYGYFPYAAQVAADRIRAYYEHKYPSNLALALAKLQEKVNWDAWFDWSLFNTALVSWDNGTTTVNINRFECNIAFNQDATLAEALDQICATCGAFWQDDGEQLVFLPPSERDPVHHFDESNIISPPVISPTDLRERPNYFVAEYRDYDDEFLGKASTPPIRLDGLIRQVGEIKSVRAFPPMRQTQAQRLLRRQARLEAENPVFCTLTGDETSIHVLPGDFVTVSHALPGWDYQRCLVVSVTLSSAENGVDTCEFTLQKIDDVLYSDTDHGPRQGALTP